MRRRLSTTCLPLLAVLVTLTLLSHDAMMAAGPHDAGAHRDLGDHDPASDDTACGELVAARTSDAGQDLDAAAPPEDAAVLPLPASGPVAQDGDGGTDPPAPIRAMLQVWLN